jgi:hypothetical protein
VVGPQNEISGALAAGGGRVLNKESTNNWGHRGLPRRMWESDPSHLGWRKVPIQFKVPLMVCPEDGEAETMQEIASRRKTASGLSRLG